MAVDTLGHLLALHVTPANEQDRAQVGELDQQVQQITGESVEVAFVDQGYTGEQAAQDAQSHGIRLVSGKTFRSQEGLCTSTQTLGSGTQFRMDESLSAISAGLRTIGRDINWFSPR